MKITTASAVFLLSLMLCVAPGHGASPTLIDTGQQVFDYWCAACHGSGMDMAGTQALAAKYNGALPASLEERTDLTPEIIRLFVRQGIKVMPNFRKTEISDTDLEALAAYLTRSK